jgi:hypothetical protein
VGLHHSLGAGLPERPGASARIQHVVTGAPEGEVAYTLQIVDGRVTGASLGRDDDAADCTFLEPYAEAVQMARGELDLHVGFMRGRLKMSGSSGALLDVLVCTQSDEYRDLVSQVAAATAF